MYTNVIKLKLHDMQILRKKKDVLGLLAFVWK